MTAARLVTPTSGDPDLLTLFGHRFGSPCPLRTMTGVPCPSCGMTRAWVLGARGEVDAALRYNVAGLLLLAEIIVNGVVHAIPWRHGTPEHVGRLARVGGLVFLLTWGVGWTLRVVGLYPLP